jgi:hypothetical protein
MSRKAFVSSLDLIRRFATASIEEESTCVGNRLTSCPARPVPKIFWMSGIPVTAANERADGGIL